MAGNVLKAISEQTAKLAYKTALYHWSLSGSVPEDLKVKPVDPWPGNADGTRFLCSGSLVIDDLQADLHTGWHALRNVYQDGWLHNSNDEIQNMYAWQPFLHSFRWLRDLRALGGDLPRRAARTLMLEWIKSYGRWDEVAWSNPIMGERIAMWIALYDFFGESADDDFQALFFEAIIAQARHLARSLPGEDYGVPYLRAIKGLLYAGLVFEGEELWIEQGLSLLKDEIKKQILADGGHASRSPAALLDFMQILLEIRGALASAKYPMPEEIQHAIDKMVPALKFFRYSDKHFAVFHGSQEGPQALVDCVLGQAKTRSKALQHLPVSGYEKLNLGRTMLMVDCGRTPAWPYDRHAHAAPLSFEMCYGKERIFVSCGTHPTSPEWKGALRGTAAHNTATINHRNACEIRDDGFFSRKVKNIAVHTEILKDAALLEASHDGYVPLNGVTHRRRLFLNEHGNDFRGEDLFSAQLAPQCPLELAIRFHIHPKVLVSLVSNEEEALLRLGSGTGWKFTHSGGVLALENSIYLGEGERPRKTKQLVLYARMTQNQTSLKWCLKKTG